MGKLNCVAYLEQSESGEQDLVIRVPWDEPSLIKTIQNCNREKNSVTLINGDIVAEASARGNVDYYAQIGEWRVQLRGGVNVYVSRPDNAGKAASYAKADAKAIAEAADADAYRWTELTQPLCSPTGQIVRKQGERILKEALADMMLSGFTLMADPAPAPEPPKVPVLSAKKRNAVLNAAVDAKAAELGIANEAVFQK